MQKGGPKRQKELTPEQVEEIRTKDFFDMILPSTEKQALLDQISDKSGVTIHVYHRLVEPTGTITVRLFL